MELYFQGITVLICSYNGAHRITETLRYLSKQIVSESISWEIILIDNASTDTLQNTALQSWTSFQTPVPFSIILEPISGKENAVDTGFRKSRYSYVIVCDDDNWLHERYIERAYLLMKNNPQIGMIGGMGIPVFESNPPKWFYDYPNYYAVGVQNKENGEVTTSKGFLWGAGSVVSKKAYLSLIEAGFKRIITYKRYPKLARSEDIELCLAIRLIGYKIWYDNQLSFKHYISTDKLQWSYLMKLTKEGGLSGPLVRPYQELIQPSEENFRKNHWISILYRKNKKLNDIRNSISLFFSKNREGDKTFQVKVANYYYFLGILKLMSSYDKIYKQVLILKNNADQNKTELI